MDLPELAYGKTLAIFLHEIELGKRQRGRNINFRNFTYKFFLRITPNKPVMGPSGLFV